MEIRIFKIQNRETKLNYQIPYCYTTWDGSKVDRGLDPMLDLVPMKSTSFLTIIFAHLRGIHVCSTLRGGHSKCGYGALATILYTMYIYSLAESHG